ncbi:SRPBCC family protein [Pedobacter sp. SD-b]|uniref:SRPBCC family protein n=1 Tax=Pedobacter segetis TaxID=2793069 RepID=A0ABS1BFM1_9SPHI|nr:SRPBCC family protein [Pedobacter segetis]MBK0381667.1 SRPBCC family protein [Pedobacter segetis]
MDSSKVITISGSRIINTSVEEAYQKLITPTEQVKWNSLYLEATTQPKGKIRNGTIMSGIFKGSGKAIVEFQNVKPNQEFTHYSKMKMFGFIKLGEFHHTYKVVGKNGQTAFTQIVSFEPKGFGRVLKNTIVKSFEKRLPESFDEFEKYVNGD